MFRQSERDRLQELRRQEQAQLDKAIAERLLPLFEEEAEQQRAEMRLAGMSHEKIEEILAQAKTDVEAAFIASYVKKCKERLREIRAEKQQAASACP